MAAPNPTELELVNKFRLIVKDLELNEFLNSDMELLRWIRARENNLEQAELMLRKHMQWREDVNFDLMANWEMPTEFHGLTDDRFIGYDRDNSPIIMSHMAKFNLKKLIHEGGAQNFYNSRWRVIAKLKDLMKGKLTPEGVPVTQMSIIMNFDGFSIRQASLQVLRAHSELSRMFEANFPEILKTCVVYNAPWFFPKIFSFIKPFLGQKTFGKVHLLGKLSEDTTEVMEQFFPENILASLKSDSKNPVSLLPQSVKISA